MNQRGAMPPGMRGFVTFMLIAFTSLLLLSVARELHLLTGRVWMICFYITGVVAGLGAWVTSRKPAA
jgi:hypothetical protein